MSDRATVPLIVPKPRTLVLRGGFFVLPEHAVVAIDAKAGERVTRTVERLVATHPALALSATGSDVSCVRLILEPGEFSPEGYSLEIGDPGVAVHAGDEAGLFHGLGTLAQILRQNPSALPCLFITDAPDLAERGFMLDISRTKVPKVSTILALIDRLAELRYNRFQLYIEHTFAFPGHETVWRDAGALTGEDIRTIDTHCRERFIKLVPNLNGFGHFERWLKHPEYNAMAECPEGFWHDLAHAHRDPGTLRPDETSLKFMASLYDAYLPYFTADEFNVGGDEPWELGQGWSRPLCDAWGKQTVYLEHMAGLHRLCAERGKRMQFWADILLEHPERAGEAPGDAVPVIWGYDAGHPFDAQCSRLKELGRTYLVAPGASTWNSFSTRWENARANIGEAIVAAERHGAAGILMTSWGDNGNHWPWPAMIPSLTLAATLSWCRMSNLRLDPEVAVDAIWYRDAGASARALFAFLETDSKVAKSVRNKSVLWEILFNPPARRAAALEGVSAGELQITLSHLTRVAALVDAASPVREGESAFVEELRAGIALSRIAARRGLVEITGIPDPELKTDFERVIADYEAAWRLRANEGGLAESAGHLRRVLGEL